MKIYLWFKSHIWRICYWIILVTAFISAYQGDDIAYRIGHALMNTFGVWGTLNVGILSFCEKQNEIVKKDLEEINARIKVNEPD